MHQQQSATITSSAPGSSLHYILVNVFTLPTIRIHRSIKSTLFTKRGLQRCNELAARLSRPLLVLYTLSLPLDIAVLLADAPIGRSCAVVKLLSQLPMLMLGVSSLRVDMLRCLLWTYEFWYFSTVNLMNCVATGFYYGDARAASALSYWLAIQMNICVDANMQPHQFSGTSLLAITYQFALLATVSMQLTPESHTTILLRYKKHTMTSNDVLVNTVATTAILLVRTAYRKRQHAKQRRRSSSPVIQCVNYRCRVELQVRADVSGSSSSVVSRSRSRGRSRDLGSAALPASMAVQKLRLATQGTLFNEDDAVCPRAVKHLQDSSEPSRKRKLLTLYSTGVLGLALNLVPFIWKYFKFTNAQFTTLWFFGISCPICYFAAFVCFFNRRLLRELVLSFDFCFLSAHLTIVHLCVCDLFIWDTRCFTVFFNWLAVHWVLTLDALTPATRRRLGLRIRFAMPVVCFVILSICRVSLDQLVFKPSKPVQDRVLWSVRLLNAKTLEFRVVPFILNRAWTVLLWCLRILWRLGTSGEDDRIIIQGNVEFAASSAALDRRDDHGLLLRNLLISQRRLSTRVLPFAGGLEDSR